MLFSVIFKAFYYKKYLLAFLSVLFFTVAVYANHKNIGIIVPLEHEAMTQIVNGIKESLQDQNVKITVKNAYGDPNILLTIIKQMQQQDILMPIGSSTSLMTISHIKNKPIVCVAAAINNKNHPLVTGVNDEISIIKLVDKLPSLYDITLLYSSSEKVAPAVKELKLYAEKNNIVLHKMMINNLTDLPLAVKNSPKNTQAFLILKDHLLASGINILKQEADNRSIPIIASDEGSVIDGATIAIGVQEKEIGVNSGLIAKDVLNGILPKNIPFKLMDSLMLFINSKSFSRQKILTKLEISSLPFQRIEIE